MNTNLLLGRKGGAIILETVISVPLILILSAYLLTSVNCVTADILFLQSVDQVSQEVALAVPVASGGINLLENATALAYDSVSEDIDEDTCKNVAKVGGEVVSALDAISDILDIDGEDVLGTIAFGEWTRDRIVTVYETLTAENEVVRGRIERVSVVMDFEENDHIIYLHVYYAWNTGMMSVEKEIDSAIPIYGDLSFSLSESDQGKDEVWMRSNFVRGKSILMAYGSNLPYNYPVIAKWNNQTATAIKSIDLTAPSYQITGVAVETINEYVDSLHVFNGTLNPWGKDEIWIKEEDILEKCLIIVIPENTPENLLSEIESCYSYASSFGITLQIETYGMSYKYIEDTNGEYS